MKVALPTARLATHNARVSAAIPTLNIRRLSSGQAGPGRRSDRARITLTTIANTVTRRTVISTLDVNW